MMKMIANSIALTFALFSTSVLALEKGQQLSNTYLRDGPQGSYQRKLAKKTAPTTPSPIDAPAPSPSALSVSKIINANVPASSPIHYNDKIEFSVTNVSPLENGQFVEFALTCNEVGVTKMKRVYTLSGDGGATRPF